MNDLPVPSERSATRRLVILPHFGRSILWRAVAVWAFLRAAASATMGASEAALHLPPSNPLHLNPFAAALVLACVGVAGLVSMRRCNEDTFLLCLGYGRLRQMAMFLAPGLMLELVAALAVAP
jgi:hypothetical protein